MKTPHWIAGMMIPFAIAILAFFVFLPRHDDLHTISTPLFLIVTDPYPTGLLDEMIQAGRLPFLEMMQRNGFRCNLVARHTADRETAWQEMMTGKEFHRIPGSGIAVDDRYGKRMIYAWERSGGALWDIASRHNLRYIVPSPYEKFDPARYLDCDLIVLKSPGDDDSAFDDKLIRLDGLCRKIHESAGERALLFVVSPFAVRPCHAVFHLNHWLIEKGFLATDPGGIDWQNTRAFHMDEAERGIRINQEDMYPMGIVTEPEYQSLKSSIMRELQKLAFPETGQPVFSSVQPGEDVYFRHLPASYPDIALFLNPDLPAVALDPSIPGESDSAPNQIFTKAESSRWCVDGRGGWILMHGEPFVRGLTQDHIMCADVAPTILFLLRLPRARDMDGRVVLTAFQEKWLVFAQSEVTSFEKIDLRVRQPF